MWFWAICIQYETFIRKVSAKLSVDCTYIVWQPSLLILSFWEPCGGLPVDESKGGLISNKRKNCSIEEIIQYTGIFLAGLLDSGTQIRCVDEKGARQRNGIYICIQTCITVFV